MSSIHPSLWFEIFIRLPVKTTFVCKCVCKFMRDIISGTEFSRMHTNRAVQVNNLRLLNFISKRKGSSSDYTASNTILSASHESVLASTSIPEYTVVSDIPCHGLDYYVTLVGSSYGLVCLSYHKARSQFFIYLWNPATTEYMKLPELQELNVYNRVDIRINNFGYDCKTDNFKLVIAARIAGSVENSAFYTFRLREMLWSTQTIPYVIHPSNGEVFLNGAFHWACEKFGQASPSVLSWDIGNENFKELQLPNINWGPSIVLLDIGVMNFCLCAFVHVSSILVEVWVMQNYRSGNLWYLNHIITHEIIVDHPLLKCCAHLYSNHMKIACIFKNGEMLFWCLGEGLLYDPKHRRVRKVGMGCCNSLTRGLSYYLETLVSLGSNTYVVTRGEPFNINQKKRKMKMYEGCNSTRQVDLENPK